MLRLFGQRLEAERYRQFVPMRVGGLDQVALPGSVPSLDLLLASNCIFDVAERLPPDQAVDGIAAGEPRADAVPVLPDAADEIGGNSGVEGASEPAGEDVGEGDSVHAQAVAVGK
jgi:hypothetical protein